MIYDVLIVGGGPAGVTAAIYAKRAGRNVAIVEKFVVGGQLNLIGEIENFTGFGKVEGPELALSIKSHAKSLDIPFVKDEILDAKLDGEVKVLKGKKTTYSAISVIFALGCYTRELGIEGEEKFKGRGVSYCAICDGGFFKDKTVAVVGSGDSAFSDANYLAPLCKHVYILTKAQTKLHNYAENEFEGRENVTILKGALSQEILGENSVKALTYIKDEKQETLDVDGVFVAIGRRPDTAFLQGKIELAPNGYIKANSKMQTSQEGVYVCGDVREDNIKQIATALGDGAIAGTEASKYVLRQRFMKK